MRRPLREVQVVIECREMGLWECWFSTDHRTPAAVGSQRYPQTHPCGVQAGDVGACRRGEAGAAPAVLLSAALSSAKCISGCDNGALYLILKYPASSQRGNPVNRVVVSFKREGFLGWEGSHEFLQLCFAPFFAFLLYSYLLCVKKKSKPPVVNGEETAVGASPPPTMVFKSLWFGAVGEGKVLSPKAPRGLCAGDSGPRAVPV